MEELGFTLTSAVVAEAVRKLGSAMTDETLVRWNLTHGLEEMKATLESFYGGLLDESNIWMSARYPLYERQWHLLKYAAYDISDMVDAYHADSAKGKPPPAAAAGPKLARMLPRLETQSKFSMSRKINKMRGELKMMLEHWHNFINVKANSRRFIDMPETSSDYEEEGAVGRTKEKQSIIAQLSYASDTRQGGTVIILPIFGLAGVGKTTLAQMVVNDRHFRDYSLVWVCVTLNFDMTKICSSIIYQLQGNKVFPDQRMESMIERLDELVGHKKTLIVLDDLWVDKDPELGSLKNLLSSVGTEVIVIVTTRREDIARKISTLVPYKLEPLDDDMCWTIIERLNFLEDRPDKQELQQIGRDIAKKCGGLPLAAEELGDLLIRKRTPMEWSALRDSDIWNTQHSSLLLSLILGYQHMPPHVRLCFAYLATFPKGHNIDKDDLIHQWISLDLIEPSDISSTTQLAEEYITMLFGMSFLQPAKSTSTSRNDDKGSMSLTMNDAVHSLAVAAFGDELVDWDRAFGRYALVSDARIALWEFSTTLRSQIRMLRFIGRNKTELSEGMFSSAKCLRVLDLRDCSMKKLPDSMCHLTQLRYLNLSGCFRLINLIKSFGNLGNLLYLDLSGCCGLVKFPESIGKLVNLVHLDLSGCCGLVKLPESIGKLINLAHLDLSGCCGLVKLPESIGKLINLVHLDLSFCCCSQGIPEALGGLTNIEHLNLSHFGSYVGEHRFCLKKLNTVWRKLSKLRYLNLSMCLNPISYYLQENECNEQFSYLSELVLLEHLDLSHNIFLTGLPDQSLRELNSLHTLDLSGCIRLKSVDRWIGELNSLKTVVVRNCRALESVQFVVRTATHDGYGGYSSNLVQLQDVDCTKLEITRLEEVKNIEEARKIRLAEKQKLRTLKLGWTVDCHGFVEDNALLEEFLPPSDLQFLGLYGYSGTCLPGWLTSRICSRLPNLVEVTMEDIPTCTALPPFGLLAKLQRLVLRRMAGITRIDAGVLSGGNRAAFRRLFTIEDMENLEEFNTTYWSDGEEFMFPAIDELVVQSCPKLKFTPSPPTAQRLDISDCDKAMSSLLKRGGGGSSSSSSSFSTTSPPRVAQLVIKNCNVPLGDWSLLHHLPGLQTLEIINCHDLSCSTEINCLLLVLPSLKSLSFSQCDSMTSLPDSMQHLTSIESMHFSECKSITTLPEWFGQLTSLQILTLDKCDAIASLPDSILKLTNLKVLRILNCPDLSKWCKLPENMTKLTKVPMTDQEDGTR